MDEMMLYLIFFGIFLLLVLTRMPSRGNASQGLIRVFRPLRRLRSILKRNERRREDRLPFVTRGRCKNLTRRDGADSFETYVLDISPSGCQIICEAPLPPTSLVSLKIPEGRTGYRLAFVAHCEGLGKINRAGLSFVPQGR